MKSSKNDLKVTIITPVFNDWLSVEKLISKIESIFLNSKIDLELLIVNDCSTEKAHFKFDKFKINQIDLKVNVGHQMAIAIGLCYSKMNFFDRDVFLIMDSDGEDDPNFILELINECKKNSFNKIVFASRRKRSESMKFIIFYKIYKILYRILTGKKIHFGNFSCVPKSHLETIVNQEIFLSNYSSSVIFLNLPYTSIKTDRSKRFYGKSKMNFSKLVYHGISSISVHMDTILIRILKFLLICCFFGVISILYLVYLKYFSSLVIPGWTSSIILIIFNLLVTNIFFISIMVLFYSYSKKPHKVKTPLSIYMKYLKQSNE